MGDRNENMMVEETKLQLRLALESGAELREAVTNAEMSIVEFDPRRAKLTADLIKNALERHGDFTDAYKLRFRGEVLLNAYQDWDAEIVAREAASGR